MSYPAGSLDIEKVKDGIFEWVSLVLAGVIPNEQVIWRNQSEALPARPCVAMKIIDGPRPVGRNASQFIGEVSSVGIQQEMTLSIQVFGNPKLPRPSAIQMAIDLNSSLIRQTILDKLKASGIAIQQVGDPRNLTALEESRYEERMGFEVLMGLVQNITDDPGTISTVNITGTLTGSQTDPIHEDFTVTLP